MTLYNVVLTSMQRQIKSKKDCLWKQRTHKIKFEKLIRLYESNTYFGFVIRMSLKDIFLHRSAYKNNFYTRLSNRYYWWIKERYALFNNLYLHELLCQLRCISCKIFL